MSADPKWFTNSDPRWPMFEDAMQQVCEQEQQQDGLFKALAAARADIENPHMDSTNPHFKSRFASLKAVVDATLPALAKHGISVVQDLQTIDGAVACYTHMFHESGQKHTFGPFILPPTKGDAQGYASASTYARRYTLMAVCGVVGDPDDDGNAASESAFGSKQQKTKVWKAIRDAASEGDELKARETWDELNTDQQKEVWHDLSSGIRSTFKELLAATKEAESA